MSRFLAVLLAALACAFAYLVVTGIALPREATVQAMFVVSSVALLLSASALLLMLSMAARLRAQRVEVQNLARSVDAAFADFAALRTSPAQAAEPSLPETESHPEVLVRRDDGDRRPIELASVPPKGNGPQAKPERIGPGAPQEITSGWLRPLLSVATGHVAGFDVLARDSSNNGAALERDLVLDAIAASARPGFAGERTPLHVAVSQALLADRAELAAVVDALRRLNGTARAIVLSLPTELMEKPAQHAAVLARLAASGSRFAAQGWPGSEADVEALWRSGVSFLRLPAARLLSRAEAPGAASMIQALNASGMAAIATDLRSDADAVELGKLGVVLMTAIASQDPARPKPGNGAGDLIHI
jgi:hypothetical protein